MIDRPPAQPQQRHGQRQHDDHHVKGQGRSEVLLAGEDVDDVPLIFGSKDLRHISEVG